MPINYSAGKIYCIRNRKDNDRIVYIGSTAQSVSERMAGHRKEMVKKPTIKIYKLMNDVGVEHFHAELMCNFPCTRREELLAEEGRHIRLHDMVDAGYNSHIAGRSQKMHYDENRERLLEEKRQYYLKNAEILREKDKAWYKANKEKAADANREYRLANAEKLKVYEAARKEERKVQKKAYREAHREEINSKRRVGYVKPSEGLGLQPTVLA